MSSKSIKEPTIKFNYNTVPITDLKYFCRLNEFMCTDQGLNDFLHGPATDFHQKGLGLTTLIINKKDDNIMGYYTIRCNALQYNTSDRRISPVIEPYEGTDDDRYINLYEVIPVIEITRFAIDVRYKRKKLGSNILSKLIINILDDLAQKVGVTAIFVLSTKDSVEFYRYVGFEEFPEDIQKRVKESETRDCVALYYTL